MLIKTKLNDLSVSNNRFVIHERNATFLPFTVYVYLVQEGKYTVLASSSRELLLLQWLVSNESPTHGPENRCCLYNAICFTSSSTSLSIVSSRPVRWLSRKTLCMKYIPSLAYISITLFDLLIHFPLLQEMCIYYKRGKCSNSFIDYEYVVS